MIYNILYFERDIRLNYIELFVINKTNICKIYQDLQMIN